MLPIEINKLGAILLAKTIKDLYPQSFPAEYRINENGFNYSFELSTPLSLSDLPKILKQMYKNIDRNYQINYSSISKSEALGVFANNTYKQQIINESENNISLIKFNNDYVDISSDLEIQKLSNIKAINLFNVSGEY
jgi:threonyl-tRNA synthetase